MATIPQSTVYTRKFKMIDSTDHLGKKPGLSPVVNISKGAGGAFAAAAGAVTEIANGWYQVALTAVDTNTLGDLAYYITATGADDTDFCDQVGPVPSNVVQCNGSAVPAGAIPNAVAGAANGLPVLNGSQKLAAVLLDLIGLDAIVINGFTLTNLLGEMAASTVGTQEQTSTPGHVKSSLGGVLRVDTTINAANERSAVALT